MYITGYPKEQSTWSFCITSFFSTNIYERSCICLHVQFFLPRMGGGVKNLKIPTIPHLNTRIY